MSAVGKQRVLDVNPGCEMEQLHRIDCSHGKSLDQLTEHFEPSVRTLRLAYAVGDHGLTASEGQNLNASSTGPECTSTEVWGWGDYAGWVEMSIC